MQSSITATMTHEQDGLGLANQDARIKTYLDDERFSQTYTLPLDATPGRTAPLTVSYADYGYHHPDDSSKDKVILICGPMLSCRFLHAPKDNLAKRHGLRIIHPERPGNGKTTAVPPEQRIEAWLRIVPALLTHLRIPHVSLLAQSGGAVFAASTLLHLRHLLHPSRPYLAMCAPWIDPCHTGSPLMSLTSAAVPSALMGRLHTVNRMILSVAPLSGFSSMFLQAVVPGMGKKAPIAEVVDAREVEFEEEVQKLIIKKAYEEDMTGLGQEALFLMRRGGKWGDWDDYEQLVDMVAAQGLGEGMEKVKMRVYFAESDMMIGTDKGPAWFDKCWGERAAGWVDYESKRVPHTNHDSIMDLRFGIAEEIFREVALLAEADRS